MAKHEKRNSKNDAKTEEKEDVGIEAERRRLEKWRPGNRNFP